MCHWFLELYFIFIPPLTINVIWFWGVCKVRFLSSDTATMNAAYIRVTRHLCPSSFLKYMYMSRFFTNFYLRSALLVFYVAWNSSFLLTLQDNLLVSSPRTLSRNVGKKPPFIAVLNPVREQISFTRAETWNHV